MEVELTTCITSYLQPQGLKVSTLAEAERSDAS